MGMDMALWDMLPVVICETAAVRDESGKLIDLEWTASNRLMNESIRPDGKVSSECASSSSMPPTKTPKWSVPSPM
jgi:hypothetical protein